MLPPPLFQRHLKLSLLLFPATCLTTFFRRFPQMGTFISLQARTLLLTPTFTVGHLPPNALLHRLLYWGSLKLATQRNCPYTSTALGRTS